jgi:hypothetical protein
MRDTSPLFKTKWASLNIINDVLKKFYDTGPIFIPVNQHLVSLLLYCKQKKAVENPHRDGM